ncbi:sigma-70 family RNA polymerase sigma factor [Demequina sp.]|uniref:sigma-70 family RNA polymerase sigma factor n=1 Tax=Demequina sp. TaxID=2050685 RepID=UPI003D0F2777
MAHWEPILDQVMRERAARLLAYAAMVTGDDAEAHDVLQEALVRSFSKRRAFAHVNAAEAYVRRAIPTVYLDGLRKRKSRERNHARAYERDAATTPDVEAQVDVQRALATLSPRERACVALRYFDDCTVQQVAHQLGIAEGTVKRYLSDATAKLAIQLGTAEGQNPEADHVPVLPTGKVGR